GAAGVLVEDRVAVADTAAAAAGRAAGTGAASSDGMMNCHTLPKIELHCHMDGIPHPDMLRHLEANGIHLGMSADALAAYYPVNGYDDFVRWFQGVKPLEGVLEAYQPLLAIHIERLKAEHVVYTEIMIAGSEIPRDRGELVGRVRAFREWTDR